MSAAAASGGAADIPLTVSWFSAAVASGPAIGDPEATTWAEFASIFTWRREGPKDGPNFVPARFTLEPDGRHVRRLKSKLLTRTAVALDIETNKTTGEVPPDLADAVARVRREGLAAVVYTSHSHQPQAPRYRVVLPLSGEIAPDLPAPEVAADMLGLAGVLDRSKIGASSLFYLPSAEYDQLDHHETVLIDGAAIDTTWMQDKAGTILAARQAEAERVAAEAHAEAAARREAKIAAGFDPDDSLIEKLRSRFDLGAVLLAHGYDKTVVKTVTKYRHPNSGSGSYGADIKMLGGVERVYSHNGTDPLHAANLPPWCGCTAIDAFDVVTILDYGGDRPKAMRTLAERFNLTKAAERKAVAALLFHLIRDQAPQAEIEAAALAEGERLGLTRQEVRQTAAWVNAQASMKEAA